MSTVLIVVLSIIVVLFILALLFCAGALIFLYLRTQKLLTSIQNLLSSSSTAVTSMIASTESSLNEKLNLIDGDGIRRAVVQFARMIEQMSKFVTRAETAALAMGEMAKLLVADQSIPRNNLNPDEYAQPDEEGRFITQSDPAKRDASTLEDM